MLNEIKTPIDETETILHSYSSNSCFFLKSHGLQQNTLDDTYDALLNK
ncbi:MAG TPA: hypothetical protein VN365_01515 [Candidatus Thermoplasmatota archaeon]|nr:hypothetical protein [Candidatus Thermoplasmatota archaeon]